MRKFVFSAFSDEIDPSLDRQIESLEKLGIGMTELRGVDGKSFTLLSDDEVKTVGRKLRNANIGISALGTPLGKIAVDDDFAPHIALANRIMDIGEELNVSRLRMFSFYSGGVSDDSEFEKAAFDRIEKLLVLAERRGFTLCHENEKDIYGCSPERERILCEHFGGRLRLVLDPGNFAFCGIDGSNAWELLNSYIDYFHIKDCDSDGCIVPPGHGCGLLAETLSSAAHADGGDIILTMEPHLTMFTGLSGLSKLDDIKHKWSFESPFEAFEFAYRETQKIIGGIL